MFGFFNSKVFNSGFLPEKEGHSIYFQEMGNPNGEIVLVFHGGPGGSCSTRQAKSYNLRKQHLIMFDQRGCGKSTTNDIIALNDTRRLIKDAKAILDFLNIKEKITVAGCSWGSTLALLFAEKYPDSVKRICLSAVFLARDTDMNWMLKQSALFYPDLLEEIKRQSEGENPYKHYAKLIFSENLGDIQTAVKYMVSYEHLLGSLDAKFTDIRLDNKIINSGRVSLYYAINRYFLEENEILKNIEKIKDIPTLIVHNRLDMCCPIEGAWDLYRALNHAEIHIVPDRGHSTKLLKETFRKFI